ncbi:MAG TPA: transcription antitermination factor NusB [Gaiellaceae bacterium]|nr:transcription antitermination factor NusB [Gaiellaceae bacterium]
MTAPARRVAWRVVRRVFEEGAYADRALRGEARGLDERDRALARRIAYGTVQRVRTIDHGIEALGRRPVRKLDPAVLAALRCAAYELAWSDAPAHAVADDAVELVREAGLERATGFANAVARRLAEGFPALVEALPEGPLKHSYPDWVHEVFVRELGEEEALALERAQNEPPPPDEAGGMSRASRLAAEVVGARPGERVLDACAAPGGKTLVLAEAGAEVTAVEVNPGRARRLAERVPAGVRVVEGDVRALAESGFDRALVDAPCSGLGVLNRRPDLRWRARPLPGLQLELLRAAAERTRPGGTVVYAVCTLNADENEAVVDAAGLEPDPLGEERPEYAHPRRPEFLLTLPHRHGTSGFFVARLRR